MATNTTEKKRCRLGWDKEKKVVEFIEKRLGNNEICHGKWANM